MKKKRLLGLLLVLSLSLPAVILAETIVLKSGKTIEGKIVERSDKYIKVDIAGVTVPYFLDEVDKIEEVPLTASPTDAGENRYINEEYGISIIAPENWHKISSSEEVRQENQFSDSLSGDVTKRYKSYLFGGITKDLIQHLSKKHTRLISFRKHSASETRIPKNPQIAIDIHDISDRPQIKDALDYCNDFIKGNINSAIFRVIEAPKEITLNGISGVVAVYEYITDTWSIKDISYYFLMPNNKVYELRFSANLEEYDKFLPEFEEAKKSFILR